MYKNGCGVDKDYTEARKWIQKAADQGNEYAKRALQQLNNGQ
jgi:TPR repeat protein